MKRSYSVLVNMALLLAGLGTALVGIELGSRVYLSVFGTRHRTVWPFRASRPPPYREAVYFGRRFLQESRLSVGGDFLTTFRMADVSGRHFTVRNGFRVTTDIPPGAKRTVLLFGGSTVFSQEVPDRHTMASHLQRLLNRAVGPVWQVRNLGIPSLDSGQQLQVLRTVQVAPGDTIVFFDGVNDVYYPIFSAYEKGLQPGQEPFRPVHELTWLQRNLFRWFRRFGAKSAAAFVALDIYDRAEPRTVLDQKILRRNIAAAARRYLSVLRGAQRLATARRATFVHFLQPSIFTLARRSAYETGLVKNPLLTPPGIDRAFRHGYPALRAAQQTARAEGLLRPRVQPPDAEAGAGSGR